RRHDEHAVRGRHPPRDLLMPSTKKQCSTSFRSRRLPVGCLDSPRAGAEVYAAHAGPGLRAGRGEYPRPVAPARPVRRRLGPVRRDLRRPRSARGRVHARGPAHLGGGPEPTRPPRVHRRRELPLRPPPRDTERCRALAAVEPPRLPRALRRALLLAPPPAARARVALLGGGAREPGPRLAYDRRAARPAVERARVGARDRLGPGRGADRAPGVPRPPPRRGRLR